MTDIVTGMRPIHPGEVLPKEFLLPMGLSANSLAIAVQVLVQVQVQVPAPAPRIKDVAREKRGVSADTALRLARYLGTSAEFWMGLQADYELKIGAREIKATLKKIHPHQQTRALA